MMTDEIGFIITIQISLKENLAFLKTSIVPGLKMQIKLLCFD